MFHAFALAALLATASEDADLLIRGGTLVDGTGGAARRADVAIRGDRIVAVGDLGDTKAARVIDAAGLVVAPGFIDLHTHSDSGITAEATRANRNYLTQGVTTIVTGNCGGGPTDVAAMFATIDEHRAGTNVIHLIPHGSLRAKVVGQENRPATPDELAEMKELVAREMKAGTWGMSTGLIYTPGCFAPTDELVELARVVAEHGGIYASHIRGEGDDTLISSITEAIRIGREAKLPVHISHLKASGRAAWGMMPRACRLIEDARAAGAAVTADQYPYTASSTSLAAMIVPAADREGGGDELAKRLADPSRGPALRDRITRELAERGGADTIRIASFAKNRSWQGKSLAEIAAAESRPAHEVAIEILERGGASAVSFSMSEDDVRLAMHKPYVATASDGSARVPDDTVPHPRSYGCFSRKIGRYAIADKVVSLEHAVRSASGLPADILRLPDRGYVRPGYFADLVIFDPAEFRDVATFDKPHQYSTGIRFAFVAGRAAIDAGEFTGTLNGSALRLAPRGTAEPSK
jgi:N-acyl-D-aspartate/D-glutamate deacylase